MTSLPAAASASMFGNYQAAKHRKMPEWAMPLITCALVFHAVLFGAMWIKTIWSLDILDLPKMHVDLALAPAPPPPPPPPPGGRCATARSPTRHSHAWGLAGGRVP